MLSSNNNFFQQIQANRMHNRRNYLTMAESSPYNMQDTVTASKRMKLYSSKPHMLQPPSIYDDSSQMKIDSPEDIFTTNRRVNNGFQSKRPISQKVLDQISSYKNDSFWQEKGQKYCPCYKCDGCC